MGKLFEELCKGPVFVIDDMIGEGDQIDQLIGEIEHNNLPVLSYKSIAEARNRLPGLLFSNFTILDWVMGGGGDALSVGVQIGEEGKTASEEEVISFINELQNICLAPVFVLSAFNKDEIILKLKSAGIITEGKNWVFVENKNVLCQTTGNLISKIEEWIEGSPHIYLAKCWTNEWLSKNTAVFWDLYELNSNWPALFYRSFEEDGEDPILALRDTLFQMILSEIDVSKVESTFINKEIEEIDEESQKESLKDLYKRLVYITKDIDKNIRPGDIFKKEGSYYLNIRPECDTTERAGHNPEVYLIKGDVKTSTDSDIKYEEPYGFIPKENQIIVHFLEGNDIVVFNKRKLLIKKYSEVKDDKICRVASPFITQMRQSYASYLGRFGVPRYPTQIDKPIPKPKEESS